MVVSIWDIFANWNDPCCYRRHLCILRFLETGNCVKPLSCGKFSSFVIVILTKIWNFPSITLTQWPASNSLFSFNPLISCSGSKWDTSEENSTVWWSVQISVGKDLCYSLYVSYHLEKVNDDLTKMVVRWAFFFNVILILYLKTHYKYQREVSFIFNLVLI